MYQGILDLKNNNNILRKNGSFTIRRVAARLHCL